jgi:hypothetical protein
MPPIFKNEAEILVDMPCAPISRDAYPVINEYDGIERYEGKRENCPL